MNTEKFITAKQINMPIENIHIAILNDKELEIIEFHIELTRHIQEIQQLFQVFRFNLKSILNDYTLMNSGNIIRNKHFTIEFTDYIVINALVINYISSGKTLIESLESCIKYNYGENSKQYRDFKSDCLNKTYDDRFSYRFLTRLRDFSQHGHLPIHIDNGKCSFNINQILSTPHFNHNKTLKNQMEVIKQEILLKYGDISHIAFTMSIAEYNMCILSIYRNFLSFIEPLLVESNKSIYSLFKSRPDIITHSDDFHDDLVFYKVTDDSIHVFSANDNSINMFENFKNEAENVLKEEQVELENLQSSLKLRKL